MIHDMGVSIVYGLSVFMFLFFLSLLPSVVVVLMVMYFYYWSSSSACMYDRYYLSTFYFPVHRFLRLFLSHISYFLLSLCLIRALPLSVLLMLVFYGL